MSAKGASVSLDDPYQVAHIATSQTDTLPPIEARQGDFLTDPSSNPFDLSDPEAIEQTVEYDPETGGYIITERIGEMLFRPPTYISFDEYMELTRKNDQQRFFNNLAGFETEGGLSLDNPLAGVDVQDNLINRLFGGDEISIQPQGGIDLTFGFNHQYVDNILLPERQRRNNNFDFDMDIQMNVTGQIGEKLKLSTAYNTQSTFNFDNQIKLDFNSDAFGEDDILKKIEAGNVSLPLRGQLIQGAQSLFGIKTELQFGHLRLTAIASQQQSENENISIQGGSQVTEFEVKSDDYDENRHFFLSHYNREAYEGNMKNLPQISTLYHIDDIQVWVTNSNINANEISNTRDIIALTDLGEPQRLTNPDRVQLTPSPRYQEICDGRPLPDNEANNLYNRLDADDNVKELDRTVATLTSSQYGLVQGRDFEKVSARKLNPREYTFHPELGFISLNITLQQNQVLAVSYSYTYNGEIFNVGSPAQYENGVSTDTLQTSRVLITKLLKSTTQRVGTPAWDLMMKNVYSIGAYQVNQEDFRLDVVYEDPGQGVKRFLPETQIEGKPLIRVFNLDNLNVQGDPQPDGVFDYIPGVTINPNNGRVIFPVLEPFGSFLANQIEPEFHNKYVYNELYEETKFNAQEHPEKNRYVIKGSYKSAASSEISLGAFNIPQGSERITAGGKLLTANVDYEIDYSTGRVRILNDAYVNVPINVSFEDNTVFGLQNKTMLGLRADYELGDNMNIGATFLNLFERPFTPKVNVGDDPINNKIYGLDFSFEKEVPWLTRAVDKLPFFSTTAPSSIAFTAETAMIDPGHAKAINQNKKEKGGVVYVDDFEGSASTIDVRQPVNQWYLASVPQDDANGNNPRFPEARLNSVVSGANRALLSWYRIDALARQGNDGVNPYTRIIPPREIFPNRNIPPTNQLAGGLQALDLSFYPEERGPYNFDTNAGYAPYTSGADLNNTDTLSPVSLRDPETRWGGIMRALTTNDFQSANIEFLEFWMLSPFLDTLDANSPAQDVDKKQGTIYFNFGNISEDILKDSRRFFENGLPEPDNDGRRTDPSIFGKVPVGQQITQSFGLSEEARLAQDVGLDGLNDREEQNFYADYLTAMNASPALRNDPSGDNFLYYGDGQFTNSDGVYRRYRRFNNTQGNSQSNSGSSLRQAGTNRPDSEDLDRDNTLNETESYFEYKLPLRFNPLNPRMIDRNETPFITDERTDPETGRIWYRFRIPLREDSEFRTAVGGIEDFRSIRFMRMYLQDFEAPVTIRFATLDLVRNQWRRYNPVASTQTACALSDDLKTFQIDAVSIEENSSKTPFNYTLPLGIQREQSLGIINTLQNEQSLALRIDNLCDGEYRSVFKYTETDMRVYERLQMFAHAERRAGPDFSAEDVPDDALSMFIRLGSDFTNNYYEYEIPLKISDESLVTGLNSNSNAYKAEVWKEENKLDFPLAILKDLKVERNQANFSQIAEYAKDYISEEGGQHKIKVRGNPNLGFVKVMMIGVRNPRVLDENGDPVDEQVYNVEVWANELRLSGLDERLGVAALGRLDVQMADLGSVTVAGNYNSVGFGALDASVMERSREEVRGYDVAANLELGKFFPEQWGLRIPFYTQRSNTTTTPEYDPYDLDIKLKDKLDAEENKTKRDSIREQAQDVINITTYNFTNVRKERTGGGGDKPKPWDVENFSATYGYTKTESANPLIEQDLREEYTGGIDYTYSRKSNYIQPFKGIKNKHLKVIKEINLNPLPNSFSFGTVMDREFSQTRYRFSGVSPIFNTYFNKRFLWSRTYDMNWDLTKALKLSFNAAANSTIDEPDEIRMLEDPTIQDIQQYRRDSIWSNIKDLGRPKLYTHNVNASYNLPIRHLPYMDWVQVRAQYNATYSWTAAALNVDSLGHTIQNTQKRQISADLNFEKFYDKIPFLKKINRPARPSRGSSRANRGGNKDGGDEDVKKPKQSRSKNSVDPVARALIRPLLLLRKGRFSYAQDYQTIVPGFMPQTHLLGMSSGFDAPGVDFVLGAQPKIRTLDENYGGSDDWLMQASEKGWLTSNVFFNGKIVQRYTEKIDGRLTLEPFKDLRIEIEGNRSFTEDYSETFKVLEKGEPGDPSIFEHRVPVYGGQLTVSYNALNTTFKNSTEELEELYQTFERYRPIISKRLGTGLHEDPDQAIFGFTDGYGRDHQDVILPAFVAAYTDQDPNSIDLDLFNTSLKPNWRLTYNGLSKLKAFKDIFANVSISHAYKSTFTISNYQTSLWYLDALSDPAASNQNDGNFYPRFDIPNVVIQENFGPLLAIDMQFVNGFSANMDYKQSRSMEMSIISKTLTVSSAKEINAGLGYVMRGVNIGFLTGKKNVKKSKKDQEDEAAGSKPGRGGQGRSGGRLGINDLDFNFSFGLRDDVTLAKRLDQGEPEPTRGSFGVTLSPSVEYQLNKSLSLRAFVDYRRTVPKNSVGYARREAAGGIVVRFQLN